MERPAAIGVLAIEEADAWFEYLEATRGQPTARYEEVEPWAWTRLGARLKTIHARRQVLLEQDDAA